MLPRVGDGLGRRVLLLAGSVAQAWESFALIALTSAGVVTALSDRLVLGPFPARLLSKLQSCPAFHCTFLECNPAGEIPPLREGDRYFLALRLQILA